MTLAFLFLAALAWGQELPQTTRPEIMPHSVDLGKAEQCVDQKQEIQRLTTLLNWYQQQFFALQARQIEQQIAPKESPKPASKPKEGEPAK